MQVLIKRWGNSAAVRIPATLMTVAFLSIGQAVEVRQENGRIVIEPVGGPTCTLDKLLANMRTETFPDEAEFSPIGNEQSW